MKLVKKLALGACAVAMFATAAHADAIKVGSAAGVTGPIAELVAAIMKGRELARDQINEAGGLLKGDTLEMVVGDTACDPKAAVDAVGKLVNVEQVVGIVGPSCSGATNASVQAVTIPAGVAVLSDSATAPSVSALKDNDTVFRVSPSDAYQGLAIAQLINKAGLKKVAMTYANDDYNAGIAAVFEREFKAMGGEITANQAHEPKKASYRAELQTLAQGGPEAVVIFSYYGSGGITMIKNSLENGLFDKFFAADGMFDQSVIDQIGADNLKNKISITQASSDTEDASYKAYAEAYKATGGDPAAPYAAHGYDATFMMALAIEKAGSADRAKIKDALRSISDGKGEVVRPGEWAKAKKLLAEGKDINYEGASGNADFDENGDVGGVFAVNVVGDDGKWAKKLLK
jgi:branched-chain amino acid transport system substrate-binding protein